MKLPHNTGLPGVLGIWGEWLFIFKELGSTCNYFQGFGEQVQSFGNLGSPVKNLKKNSHYKGKAFISFDFLNLRLLGGVNPKTPWEIYMYLLSC